MSVEQWRKFLSVAYFFATFLAIVLSHMVGVA